MNFFTIQHSHELMNERLRPGEGAKSWDKFILILAAIVYLLNVIIAGIDAGRYHWSPVFHWSLHVFGAVLMIAGQIIFLKARSENIFFSSIIRIQHDRRHCVCDTGLYSFVRHPGYLGVTISLLGFPFITGSLWSIITTTIAALLLFIRTDLEDNTLISELKGYLEYSKKIKYRLIPKLW